MYLSRSACRMVRKLANKILIVILRLLSFNILKNEFRKLEEKRLNI